MKEQLKKADLLGLAIIAAAGISYSVRSIWSVYQTIAVILGGVLIVASFVVLRMKQAIPLEAVFRELLVQQGIFFWPRVIFGVLVPIVLSAMIWSTVKIRHTQAATGLLYLAVVALLFGEFFSKFLLFAVSIPI